MEVQNRPIQPFSPTQAPETKSPIKGAASRLEQRNIRCYKCNEIDHISTECSKRQSSLTSTSKGKHITLEAKSEDKPKDDSEIIPDDGIVGDGPETLMVRRSMLAPREVEDGPEIEEINNDED